MIQNDVFISTPQIHLVTLTRSVIFLSFKVIQQSALSLNIATRASIQFPLSGTVIHSSSATPTMGDVTSHLFSIPFFGVQHLALCGIQCKVSHLCHCSLSEGSPRHLSQWLHKYKPSCQLHSSSDIFMPCVLPTNRLLDKGPSPSLAPQSGTVCPLTFTPKFQLLHSDRLLIHLFNNRYFVSNETQLLI